MRCIRIQKTVRTTIRLIPVSINHAPATVRERCGQCQRTDCGDSCRRCLVRDARRCSSYHVVCRRHTKGCSRKNPHPGADGNAFFFPERGYFMSFSFPGHTVICAPTKGGGVKNAKWPFYAGSGSVYLRKSATELLCAKTVSSRVVRYLLAQIVGGDIPLNTNFVREMNHPLARRRCILWHFNRCLLTGETNCNSNLQQCSLNT